MMKLQISLEMMVAMLVSLLLAVLLLRYFTGAYALTRSVQHSLALVANSLR